MDYQALAGLIRLFAPFGHRASSSDTWRMDAPRPRAAIEPPEGWTPQRMLLAELQRLGYTVVDRVHMGTGEHLLVLR